MSLITRKLLHTLLITGVLCLLSVAAVAAQASGAATPSQAVAALVDPLAGQGTLTGCNALTGQLADCPITKRLRARLAAPIPGVETGNLVSRSQSPPRSLEVAQVKLVKGATIAQVNTRWATGTTAQPSAYIITFVVHKAAGGWLVADSYCLNDTGSSIYNQPTGPCPQSSSTGGAAPGMPVTGAETNAGLVLVLFAGLLIAAIGLLVRRGTHPAR